MKPDSLLYIIIRALIPHHAHALPPQLLPERLSHPHPRACEQAAHAPLGTAAAAADYGAVAAREQRGALLPLALALGLSAFFGTVGYVDGGEIGGDVGGGDFAAEMETGGEAAA